MTKILGNLKAFGCRPNAEHETTHPIFAMARARAAEFDSSQIIAS